MKKNETLKVILKILLVAFFTTMCRMFLQLLMPGGSQTILKPSIFVKNGSLPLVFAVYGFIAYSAISTLFLFVRDRISGHKVIKGVKYGLALSAIWSIYLLEPLPHVNQFIDKVSYPLADSTALIVMGILLGLFLCDNIPRDKKNYTYKDLWGVVCIALCFCAGRLFQYLVIDIYSSFHDKITPTVLWMVVTGVILGIILNWFRYNISERVLINKSVLVGIIIFGVNITFFNFFIILVFDSDILDLLIRTGVDIIAVTIGMLLFAFIGKGEKC